MLSRWVWFLVLHEVVCIWRWYEKMTSYEKTAKQYSMQCIRTYLYSIGATCPISPCFKSNVQCTCIYLTWGNNSAQPGHIKHSTCVVGINCSLWVLFSAMLLFGKQNHLSAETTTRTTNLKRHGDHWSWFPNEYSRMKELQWMDLW